MNRQRKSQGFTLVEIMVVVFIVVGLITIAIPNILRSRIVANEASTLAHIKLITNSCQYFRENRGTYPSSLTDLTSPVSNPAYIDSALATGIKQGYSFTYKLETADHFTLIISPITSGFWRGRYFYSDESGTIHFNERQEAGPSDQEYRQ